MNITKIDSRFSFTSQIGLDDLPSLASAGFCAVICNRPDNEEAGQPCFADIKSAADAAGLKAFHIPIVPGRAGPSDVQAFRAAFDGLEGPVLGYCRSGARSNALYGAIS